MFELPAILGYYTGQTLVILVTCLVIGGVVLDILYKSSGRAKRRDRIILAICTVVGIAFFATAVWFIYTLIPVEA